MKKILTLAAVLMMVSTAANAQLMTSNSSSKQLETKTKSAVSPYNKLFLSYSPLTMSMVNGGDSMSESGYNSIGLTWMYGAPLAKFPLYLEFGAGVNYYFYDKNNVKFNDVSVNIPVNILYRFAFGGGKLHLAPYTGIYGRINAWGKVESGSYEIDPFGDEGGYGRFQLGWQIGVHFSVSKFYVHVGYLTDVTNMAKNSDYGTIHLSGAEFGVGLVF